MDFPFLTLNKNKERMEWINVNDRLPDELETVWLSNGKGSPPPNNHL